MKISVFDVRLERKLRVRRGTTIAVTCFSITLALLIGAIVLSLTGHPPFAVYRELSSNGDIDLAPLIESRIATGNSNVSTEGADYLISSVGGGLLSGNGGDDLLFGGRGSDVLEGGAGDDMLWGGLGAAPSCFRKLVLVEVDYPENTVIDQ